MSRRQCEAKSGTIVQEQQHVDLCFSRRPINVLFFLVLVSFVLAPYILSSRSARASALRADILGKMYYVCNFEMALPVVCMVVAVGEK